MSELRSATGLSRFCSELKETLKTEIEHLLATSPTGHESRNVQHGLVEMEEMLSQTCIYLRQQYNACSFVARLSDELVTEILQYCHYDTTTFFPWTSPVIPPAFNLCARWRHIAICSPHLWAKIPLPMNANLLQLFSDRALSRPLDVVIRPNDNPRKGAHREIAHIGSTLLALVPRISQLRIRWDDDDAVGVPLGPSLDQHIGHREFTFLQELRISHDSSAQFTYTINAPNLRILHFRSANNVFPNIIAPDLVKLVLEETSLYYPEILAVLKHFPSLEQCIVRDVNLGWDDGGPPVSLVSLPKLRDLTLQKFLLHDMADAIDHIVIPSTTNITLSVISGSGDGVIFEEFISRWNVSSDEIQVYWNRIGADFVCTWTSKSGRKIDVTSGQLSLSTLAAHFPDLAVVNLHTPILPVQSLLVEALGHWKHITHLSVSTTDTEFERLLVALETTSEVLCPHLRVFGCPEGMLGTSRMMQFLDFRKNQGARIEEVKVITANDPSTFGY
ncbi:hypothetical protein SISSUDRAFT_1131614 [Sistotremastrum suecicum HHB10207 ss-3]|uniref:F-box domain-containing protein n=1 Tax=Sistotremastrum suecicum HHB10207 ss-3 TaxID=1314776 RepID=A0A165ZYF5_9AGAM|nr:hypothetical protein SISSUDRAFT_1131614 [Sistotremastrum suecicum HHB10207 ss-3]